MAPRCAPCKVIKQLHKIATSSGQDGWLDKKQTKELGRPIVATAHGTARATLEPERRYIMQAWTDYCYSKCDK